MRTNASDEDRWNGLHRAIRTLVVLDVVESVRLMQADEAGFIHRWRRFVNEVVTQVLPPTEGRLVKSLGDGLLLEFGSVNLAVSAALEVQRRIQCYNADCATSDAIYLRVGAHVASVVVDQLDVFGAGVNLAARLAALAGPDEIVVSAEVREQLVDGLDVDIEDIGDCFFRHVDGKQRAYRIGPPTSRLVWSKLTSLDDFDSAMRASIAIVPPISSAMGELGETVCDVLADALINHLSRNDRLRVISRLSSSTLKTRTASATEAGRLLQATYIVNSNLTMPQKVMSLDIELVRAESGRVLWSGTYSLTAGHGAPQLHALSSEIAEVILRQVVDTEVHGSLNLPLPTLEAYSLLLSSTVLMHRVSKSDFDRAGAMLEHLIARHSRAPLPRAWLAQWYVLKLTRGWSARPDSDAAAALSTTRRAVDLEPDCSLALTMAGFVQCHLLKDLDSALSSYGTALQANPSEALAWLFKGVAHTFKGEGAEAIHASEQALALSPLDPMKYYYESLSASAAVAAGQFERAIDLCRRSLDVNRAHSSTYRALAMAQAMSGLVSEARATAAQLLAVEPGFTIAEFMRRSPSARYPAGARYAQALREAGIPE